MEVLRRIDGDGRETGGGRAGMEIKSARTGGDGCNFCPLGGLYFVVNQ